MAAPWLTIHQSPFRFPHERLTGCRYPPCSFLPLPRPPRTNNNARYLCPFVFSCLSLSLFSSSPCRFIITFVLITLPWLFYLSSLYPTSAMASNNIRPERISFALRRSMTWRFHVEYFSFPRFSSIKSNPGTGEILFFNTIMDWYFFPHNDNKAVRNCFTVYSFQLKGVRKGD